MKSVLIFLLLLINQIAWAKPIFMLELDNNDAVKGVSGVIHLRQNDDTNCSAGIFVDHIVSFDHRPDSGSMKIHTQNNHSPDGLFLDKRDLKEINLSESRYLSVFLKTHEKIVFIGDRCGSGGYFNINSMIKLSKINDLKSE